MRSVRPGACTILAAALAATLPAAQPSEAPRWTAYSSGVAARLRGISAVSDRVVWASGAAGTIIRTDDGGVSWAALRVPGADDLDFRDIDAVDPRTAYVLSIGPGDASRIYKTVDAGRTWSLQFRNEDPEAFFDAMSFSAADRGYAVSDAVAGRLVVLATRDGERWSRIPADALPPALHGEGAFAASGTNIALQGDRVWIGTSASRVIRSTDAGRTWAAFETPLPSGPSSGIFSLAFRDERHGIAVGGDYKREQEGDRNAARSADGGVTWTLVAGMTGLRSAVAFVPSLGGTVVATGPAGSDYSTDFGVTWRPIPGPGFHTLGVPPKGRAVWAAGEGGRVSRLDF